MAMRDFDIFYYWKQLSIVWVQLFKKIAIKAISEYDFQEFSSG